MLLPTRSTHRKGPFVNERQKEGNMTKVLRLTITTICLLALLLLTAGGADARTLTKREAWSFTGSMHTSRFGHRTTRLQDGKVLVSGGVDASGNSLATAEVYDPTTGMWSLTGSMNSPRSFHTSTLLSNGKVLVTGGCIGNCIGLSSAELYDPATGTWSLTGSMNTVRDTATATLLTNGMVLVAGGGNDNGILATAELYNP